MMYRNYFSQAEWDEIVNNDGPDPDIRPHCNPEVFHRPGTCPFCDGYFRRHPPFVPRFYADADANGWGGNAAPSIDDKKAAEEQEAWAKVWDDFDRLDPVVDENERTKLKDRVREIVAKFTGES